MKKKLLALALAAIMACSLLAPPALAAEAELACEVRPDGGVEVTVPAVTLSGSGVVQVATYSAQGRLMDFKTATVDDLAQGYHGILSARTEPGGSCKAFLLGGEGYRPLTENAQVETKGPAKLLATVTKGAKFASSSSIWNNRADSYVGVDCETDENGYAAPGKVTYYINGRNIGSRAVDAQPGDIARIYDTDGNGKADTVMVSRYWVAQLTGDVTLKGEMVSIPGVTNGFIPTERVNGPYTGLKEGDVVLFSVEGRFGNEVVTLEIPKAVVGKVVRVNSKGWMFFGDGSIWYGPTGIAGGYMCTEDQLWSWDDFENEYTFYLDKNGGICYYECNTAVLPPVTPAEPVVGSVPTGLFFRVDDRYSVREDGSYIINVLEPTAGDIIPVVVDDLSYVDEALEMYAIDSISDGVITGMTKISESDADRNLTVGTLWSISAGMVLFGDGTQFWFDHDNCACTIIDLKPNGDGLVYESGIFRKAMGDYVQNDFDVYEDFAKMYVITDEKKTAQNIYVVRTLKES